MSPAPSSRRPASPSNRPAPRAAPAARAEPGPAPTRVPPAPALKVCLVASECAPFAKTGGLADVSAALLRYLGQAGCDARLFLPLYRSVRSAGHELVPVPALQDIPLSMGGRRLWFSVWTAKMPHTAAVVHFVRCPELYEREGIYTQDGDEHVRFACLCRAVIEACQRLRWAPDVFHVHDWHTALLPLYLRTRYGWDALFQSSRTLLTIHNVGYQGTFGAGTLKDLDLEDARGMLWQEDLARDQVNFLKTGIVWSTALTTVSRSYAREIQGDEHGLGLQTALRQRGDHLFGIVNGVDYHEWSPEHDRRLPHRYSPQDLSGKARMQAALLERCGLPPAGGAPVAGVISRLTQQKGIELLHDALAVALQRTDLRLVALGSGEERYEAFFRWLTQAFPGKVAYLQSYDEELAHWIEAGADLFLMPSRYEPCGLNQMYSLRYGTVPIVRRTGGLADTVEDCDAQRGTGTGFVFNDFDAHAFSWALDRALALWRDQDAWRALMLRGMAQDFSWERQVQEYIALYRRLPGL